MLAGHYGLAAAAKSVEPRVPLWALMLATQLMDVVFVVLFILGVEEIETVSANPYGGGLIHADWDHSLVGALLLAVAAGLLARRRWGRRGGLLIGGLVFSHWVLDLLVHRPDLPILPGNAGGLPRLGLGLWETPALTAALELLLVLAGSYLYYRSAVRNTDSPRGRVLATTAVLAGVMLLTLLGDVAGLG